MQRRSPAVHGLVKIPKLSDEWKDSGEGGLTFWAVWPMVGISACAVDLVFWATGNVAPQFNKKDGEDLLDTRNTSIHFDSGFNQTVDFVCQSAIYIGSTGQSWTHKESCKQWVPRFEDLTSEGRDLIVALNKLIGITAIFCTELDT